MIRNSLIVILMFAIFVSQTVFAQDVTPATPAPEATSLTEVPILEPTVDIALTLAPATPAPANPILPSPTPVLPPPSLVTVASADWRVGAPGEIAFILDTMNSAPINAIETQCSLTPSNSITAVQIVAGSLAADAVIVNSGFHPDGTWIFAVAQRGAPLGGGVFRISALGAAAGAFNLACMVTGVSMDGARLPLVFAPLTLVIGDALAPSETPALEFTPAITPTLEATPDVLATAEPTLEVTAESTPEPTPTPEEPVAEGFAPAPAGSISGQVALSETAPVGVVVSLRGADGRVIMLVSADDAGAFRFDAINAGDYVVVAEAAGYLPATLPITLGEGGGATLGTIQLFAGDVVPSDPPVIDELDVVQFSAWYGDPTLYDPRGDFNRDGEIDVLDLRILAENLRRTG